MLSARKKLITFLTNNPVSMRDAAQRVHSTYVPRPINFDPESGKFRILASDHKVLITTWLAFWPFSIIGTAFEDIFPRLWQNLYEVCQTAFQRIADAVFADVNK